MYQKSKTFEDSHQKNFLPDLLYNLDPRRMEYVIQIEILQGP